MGFECVSILFYKTNVWQNNGNRNQWESMMSEKDFEWIDSLSSEYAYLMSQPIYSEKK